MQFVSGTDPIISCPTPFEKSGGPQEQIVVSPGVQALTFQAPYDIKVSEVPDPVIEHPHEALVRVRSSALCGSDLHPYRGHEVGCDIGTVMGHEFVGEIVEVGSAVRHFRPGLQVFSPFTTCCGSCQRCSSGLTCRCSRGQLLGWVENGVGLHGAQAEMVKIPLADATLLELPDGLSDEEALLLGDNLATGYYGALRAGVKAGESCLVVGCGTVGHGYVQGRSKDHALQTALIDALMQTDAVTQVEAAILAPLRKGRDTAKATRAAKAAATKVDFFTMVRGED